MSAELVSARAVAPGKVLKRELEARGWTQKDLASILGRPEQAVSEIITAKKQVTPETALELAQALGTTAELWLNLESRYRLALGRQAKRDESISRRSALYSRAPIRELARKGWIEDSDDLDRVEEQVDELLGWSDKAGGALAARRTRTREADDTALVVWLCRVRQQAAKLDVAPFDPNQLDECVDGLRRLTATAEDIVRVPELLLRHGVRLVIVPHLSGTHLDGALTRDSQAGPIVALTLRHDRLDNFWFTLMHEIAHLVLGHQGTRVDDLDAPPTERSEIEADRHAQELLVPGKDLALFVRQCGRYVSRARVETFARDIDRAPGIVVGRLHHEGHLPYTHLRSLLPKVSPYLMRHSSESSS